MRVNFVLDAFMQPIEPHYSRHPVEDIEPEIEHSDAFREASKIGLRLLNNAMLAMLQGRMSRVTFWQICYGIGLPLTEGRSMSETAKELGVSRAALSKGSQKFRRSQGLPPNPNGKSAEASKSYSETRNKQL